MTWSTTIVARAATSQKLVATNRMLEKPLFKGVIQHAHQHGPVASYRQLSPHLVTEIKDESPFSSTNLSGALWNKGEKLPHPRDSGTTIVKPVIRERQTILKKINSWEG